MPLPLVTVVIPAFNASEWIQETLASVAAQTYQRNLLEVVVVDDGSTDETLKVAEEAVTAIGVASKIIRNAAATGPSAARNRGWRAGRGEWVQFLDADDLLDPLKIDRQARAAAAVEPEVAAIFSPWSRIVRRDEQWVQQSGCVRPSIGADPLLDVLRTESFVHLGSSIFSRKWLERTNGFAEAHRMIEDVDLLMRIVMVGGRLHGLPAQNPLSWYRQREGSLSRSDGRAFVDGCLRNARLADTYWSDRGALTPERRRVLAEIYSTGARYYAERDGAAFDRLVDDITRLVPGFAPQQPGSLRVLAKLLGYAQAERCAVQYRRLKRSIRKSFDVRPRPAA